MYIVKPEIYNKLLKDNLTAEYKKVENEIVDNINIEAKEIAEKTENSGQGWNHAGERCVHNFERPQK